MKSVRALANIFETSSGRDTEPAPSKLGSRRQILRLIIIMVGVALLVAATSIWVLYEAAFDQQRARLVETAQSQARFIEAVGRFNEKHPSMGYPGGPGATTLSQITDAHERYKGFGDTGEFTLATHARNWRADTLLTSCRGMTGKKAGGSARNFLMAM